MYIAHTNQTGDELYEGNMMDHGWGNDWTVLVWMALWLLLLAIGTMMFLNYIKTKQSNTNPLNELENRYAKGEIDKKEYETIKKDLSKK